MGQVHKLSNWGYSNHPRFLKLNKKGLSYFRKNPPDTATKIEEIEALTDYLPKYCVPLSAIVSVDEITDAERDKNKKFFKTEDGKTKPGFKVTFYEK